MPRGHLIEFTPQQDEVIRKCWSHNHYGNHAAKRASELVGYSMDVCHRRAMQLGLVFTRERFRWTEPELRVVEENAHQALETIQRKLMHGVSPPGVKRTRTAIASQIHMQRFRTNMDGLKHGPLADALGISSDKLRTFRASKLIAGERMESIREECGYTDGAINAEHLHWFYHNDDIVRLLFSARGEVDMRKVNQTWLMGLLEPYITIFQPPAKDIPARDRDRKRIEILEDLLFRAERELTSMPQKRRRGRPSKAESECRRQSTIQSTPTQPRARPGLLSDETIAAIRAGESTLQRVVRRHGKSSPSSGGPVSHPSSIATGMMSKPSGESSRRLSEESGPEISLSGFPSSGLAGDLSASSPTASLAGSAE
jgi:hypothetical protein